MQKLLLFLLLPFASEAQRNYPALLDRFMQAAVSVNHFNGNVLVAKSGKIIYQKAFGYRNYDTKEPLDNNSVFELQSITKQFTCMAILMLVEKGKLTLTDSIRHFFPELPYSNVTIRNLLTHTSGLPDDLDVLSQYWDQKKVAFNQDLINILASKNIPPHFKPGENVEYSNTAFDLLASIVEKASGLSYADFLRRNIFIPLRMHSSHIYTTTHALKQDLPNFAYGYIYSDSLRRYILPALLPELDFVIYCDDINGAGNVSSTTGDLLKWDRALKTHQLISKRTQDEMLSPQSAFDSASKVYWGYGAHRLHKNELGEYISGGGGWPRYAHSTIRYPKDDLTIIILSNNESTPNLISSALAYIVADRQVEIPYRHIAIPLDTALLNRYLGQYTIPNVPTATKMELFTKEGKLFYRYENSNTEMELKAESPTKFFNKQGTDQQIEFEVTATGKVSKALYIIGGMEKQMKKIK